jgi:hypothetical protein
MGQIRRQRRQQNVERALVSARKFRAGWPRRDCCAINGAGAPRAHSVVAALLPAENDKDRRAFDWHGVVAPANFRIDAGPPPILYLVASGNVLASARARPRK